MKTLNYLLILILFPIYSFRYINPAKSQLSENKLDPISINYLKKIPNSDYIIGPGDKININVSRDYPELNSNVTIDGEGTVYLPKLRRVYIKGLDIRELNELLEKAYKKYVKYPSIEISILKYRPINILVEGEVLKPGLISLEGSLSGNIRNNPETISTDVRSSIKRDDFVTQRYNSLLSSPISNYYFPRLFDAIRQSGGITPYSNLTKVQIIRKTSISKGGGKITTTLDFTKVFDGDNSQNIRIYDNDIIRIPKSMNKNDIIFNKAINANINPMFTNVFVVGRVKNPGNIKISSSSVLTDAVQIAGGTKVLKGPVSFIRYQNDGNLDKRKFRFRPNSKRGSYYNPILKNGDLIVVGNSPFSISAEVINEVTSPFTGLYSAYSLIKAITD